MGTGFRKQFITDWEKQCSALPLLPRLYLWRYRPMVRRELALVETDSDDRILQVGCGSVPATAALLARWTDTEVTAVDHDPEAVANARRTVRHLGLADTVSIQEADGRTVPTAQYSVVHVALHTVGKTPILENFLEDAESADRAILRYPRPSLGDTYGQPPSSHRPDRTVSQVGANLDRSALFSP